VVFSELIFLNLLRNPVPEIIDPVFAKTSQNARFLLSENERFGLVFVKTGSINSGTGIVPSLAGRYDNPICRTGPTELEFFNNLWGLRTLVTLPCCLTSICLDA
jgi:hypothetical protein